MKIGEFHAKQLHLVLIGGGHAQIQVLKSFAMKPVDGLAITLITDVLHAPYSGMLPGFVEGVWHADDIHIDLTRLASFAGASVIHAPVSEIDPKARIIHFESRPSLGYDILSLNCGAVPDLDKITGADNHSIAVKPIAHFLEQLPDKRDETRVINIIGAGVAGLELAFAFCKRYESQNIDINVFSRAKSILPTMPTKAGRLIGRLAKDKGITIHDSTAISAMDERQLTSTDGRTFPSGLNFVVTGVKASPFVASLDGTLDKDGFVSVSNTLQSPYFPEIFAAGDIASTREHPREKAGVFAVRAGAILAENLRRYIFQQPLKKWRPQKRYLALIGTGDGKAVAIRNGLVAHHSLFWRLKLRIDKAFMDKFNNLPKMTAQAPLALPLYEARHPVKDDPIFAEMRCTGCAAKASASLLDTAMARALNAAHALGVDKSLLADDGALGEDAGLTPAISADLRHSFDSLTQMVPDPFIFGQIAVNHALSDLYVAGAKPLYATAHLNLEEASEPYQQEIATQLLTGALLGLGAAQARLIGGHTSQSRAASLGFAVTGAQTHQLADYEPSSDYVLVMTKKLGIGTALAALMRQKAGAALHQEVIDAMLLSNQHAAECFFAHGAIAMTDITGFGLARHTQNLLSRLPDTLGARLSLSALSSFDGIEAVINAGIRSSLFDKNRQAGIVTPAPSLSGKEWRLNLLFDPQTSGGVLALIPAASANQAMAEIQKIQPAAHPAIIGTLTADATGIIVES